MTMVMEGYLFLEIEVEIEPELPAGRRGTYNPFGGKVVQVYWRARIMVHAEWWL